MDLRIRRLSPNAVLPAAAHPGDAGLDLHAAASLTIAPGAWATVPTGIVIELPPREVIGLALLFAYVNGRAHVVDALFERDGDWNAIGVLNGTALHRAAWAGDLDMVQRLVARGADPSDRRNPYTATAFGWAVHNRQTAVADWLRAMGLVDLHDAVAHDLTDDVEARLRDDPEAANLRRDHWNIPAGTPLHWAAARNRPLIARILLANGADPNALDGRGRSPLDYAVEQEATAVSAIIARHGGRRFEEA